MTSSTEQRRSKLTWRDLLWALGFLLTAGPAIGVWLRYPALGAFPWGAFLLLLDVLVVPALFLIRWRSSDRFWRENRWIIAPAVVLLLLLLNSAWLSSYISFTYLREAQEEVLEANQGCKLHVSYPSYFVYESTTPAEIHLRTVCENSQIRPLIALKSTPQFLLLSPAEQGSGWQKHLEVVLPGDGTDAVIYARVENANVKFLSLIINGVDTGIKLSVQNSDFEKHLKFVVNLLQSGSLFFTIIGAIFAGLKQVDEQKINERKRVIDALLSRILNFKYENGKLNALVGEIALEIRDWGELWTEDQKGSFQKNYPKLFEIGKDLWQEAARLQNAKDFIQTAGAICLTTRIDKPGALVKLEMEYPGYKPEWAPSYFPPEVYPLEKVLAKYHCAQIAEDHTPSDHSGMDLWHMHFHPFKDWKNPFHYGKYEVSRNKYLHFPLLDDITFSFPAERNIHQTYYFQTGWDLRAALYQYCADYLNRSTLGQVVQGRETFFVPVFPDALPAWRDDRQFLGYLLHALAGAWMRALAHNPYLVEESTPIQQQMVADLLVSRYGDAAAVKKALFAHFAHPELPLSPSLDFLKLLDQVSPSRIASRENLAGLLSLRPFETKYTQYLCAQMAPNGDTHGTLSFYLHNSRIETELRESQSFAVRFLLAGRQTDPGQVLRMNRDNLLTLLDSRVKMSTNNLSPHVFSALFYPPPKPKQLDQFLTRANGSPGTIVKMAHDLMALHLTQHPDVPEISPELLDA